MFIELQSLLQRKSILALYGKSDTRKTSFALQYVGWSLTNSKPYQGQCAWIQASELFPSRRLAQLFKDNKEKLDYINNNIFISPFKGLFSSYQE